MNRILTMAAGCALALCLGACGASESAQEGSAASAEQSGSQGSEQLANPVVEYDTLADASAAAGFDMEAPEELLDLSATDYDVIDDELIQVIYGNEGQLTVRKGADETDVSGVYETYDATDTIYVDDVTVTCQGNGGSVSLVTWTVDGHFFSAFSTDGITMDDAYEIASSVK